MEGWNGQKAFTFYASFADFCDILSEKEQKELYFSIVRYMFFDDDREEKLSKATRAAFTDQGDMQDEQGKQPERLRT